MNRPGSVLATLCYLKRNGKTLMMHRVNKENDIHEGKWNGLGGKFEAGETPEECVVREVREEAGVDIVYPRFEGVLTFPRFADSRDWYVFVFTCTDFEGEPLAESREGRLEWIEDENLLDLNLWEGDLHFLRWIEQPEFFSAKFEYRKGELKDYSSNFYSFEKSRREEQ